ncbi:hypothetical protein [Sorangium sp. So ce406]|uniref:hypothetical protein n=1 Tax=Sorangium sp. So ce406 TaxID=3133311 RepID=UPI003F5C4109
MPLTRARSRGAPGRFEAAWRRPAAVALAAAVYAGFPRAVKGLAVLEKGLAERGGEPGPR